MTNDFNNDGYLTSKTNRLDRSIEKLLRKSGLRRQSNTRKTEFKERATVDTTHRMISSNTKQLHQKSYSVKNLKFNYPSKNTATPREVNIRVSRPKSTLPIKKINILSKYPPLSSSKYSLY